MPGPSTKPQGVISPENGLTSLTLFPGENAQFRKHENWRQLPDGSIETLAGPTPYEADHGSGYQSLGHIHGVFHTALDYGAKPILLIRAGTQLYYHAGWKRQYVSIASGLSNDPGPKYPDVFLQAGSVIIWCNGVDAPIVINEWFQTSELGFDGSPPAPIAKDPIRSPSVSYYPNSLGSWTGGIGTPGDILSGQVGQLLPSAHNYYHSLMDWYGNRSPVSPASNTAIIRQITAEPYYEGSTDADCHRGELDQLTRQFGVFTPPITDKSNIMLHEIWRTRDTAANRNGPDAYLEFSVGGSTAVSQPSTTPDGLLSEVMVELLPVEPFVIACMHDGCLTVVPISEPMCIQESDPGFFGTWPKNKRRRIGNGGGEVTGLVSFAGRRLAFTRNAIFDVTDFSARFQTISQGIGLVAPGSLCSAPDGKLRGLSESGWWEIDYNFNVIPISPGLVKTVRQLNSTYLKSAVAAFDSDNGEYLCALASAGSRTNDVVWRYDGKRWTQYKMGSSITAMCSTDDNRKYVLLGGHDGTRNIITILSHETAQYTAPNRTSLLRTQMIRDDAVTSPIRVRDILIQLYDGSSADSLTVKWYKNDIWTAVGSSSVTAMPVRMGSDVPDDVVGSTVIGTSKVTDARCSWRRVTIDMTDCFAYAIEISINYPNYARIGSIIVRADTVSRGDTTAGRVPGPRGI